MTELPEQLEWQFTEETLLAAVMIVHSVPCRTIEFAVKILPELRKQGILSAVEMGEAYGCTRQTARLHARVLTARGYLRRVSHSGWESSRLDLSKIGVPNATEGNSKKL